MKRFISLFIALLLILPLIAGCTEDDDGARRNGNGSRHNVGDSGRTC